MGQPSCRGSNCTMETGQDMALLLSSMAAACCRLCTNCQSLVRHPGVGLTVECCCCALDAACPAAWIMPLIPNSLHPAGIMVSGCFDPEGGLWMWGANTNSQLGKGDEDGDELVPLKVRGAAICKSSGALLGST